MEREEYISELEKKNGECPHLKEFIELKKHADGLVNLCAFYSVNVDLEDPKASDRDFLEAYKSLIKARISSVYSARNMLNYLLRKEKLKLKVHAYESGEFREQGYASPARGKQLIKRKDIVMTIHCFECDQQIDTAEPAH